jgi:transposase
MLETAHTTSSDPAVLRGIIGELVSRLAEAQQEREAQTAALEERELRIEQLLETIELLRRKRCSPSAERVPEGQLKLFDEVDLEALIEALERDLAAQSKEGAPKRKPVRRPLPAHLPPYRPLR